MNRTKRDLLIATTVVPAAWATPIIKTVVVPAHATTTTPSAQSCTVTVTPPPFAHECGQDIGRDTHYRLTGCNTFQEVAAGFQEGDIQISVFVTSVTGMQSAQLSFHDGTDFNQEDVVNVPCNATDTVSLSGTSPVDSTVTVAGEVVFGVNQQAQSTITFGPFVVNYTLSS